MKKIIKIDGKEYTMQATAYTQFAYKNETGRTFLQDIKKLVSISKEKIDINNIDVLEDLNNLLLPISFVMIKEADDKQITDYQSFLMSIDNLYDDVEWITEVILLACSPISRQLQSI